MGSCRRSGAIGPVALSLLLLAARAGADKPCPAGMARLDGGAFTSKRGGEVKIAAFCVDATEVTVDAYKKCVDGGKCTEPDREAGESCNWGQVGDPAEVKRGAHPQNCVDHAQAQAYCAAQGKRLPTVDEFEWAQRGGAAGTPFPWGDDRLPRRVCARANKNPDYPRAPVTCPVASCPSGASPQKVHDLSGGLQEWTASPHPKKPAQRLVCGGQTSCQAGSVNRIDKTLEAGFCLEQDPAQKFEGVGFRCAK